MQKPEFIVPFNEEEMTKVGEYPGFGPGVPGTPIYKTPIQPYENIKMFLADEKPLWMPSFLEFKMFNPSMLVDNVARGMVKEADAPFLPEQLINPDYFGIDWEYVPVAHGSIVHPGHPTVPDICEWEKYIKFPDLSELDWSACAVKNEEFLNDGRAIQMAVFTGLFERLISFVDMENALMALIDPDEQEAVHRLFDKLCEFYDSLFYHMAKFFNPDLLWFHDDWGSQKAPLFSLDTCREMIVPYLKRIVDSAHSYGIGFEFHCCGKNEILVPAMIEAGVDMWAGQEINDKEMLYREYGDAIKLGVDIPPMPMDASEQQKQDIVGAFLDKYPKNTYVGMSFGFNGEYYSRIYRESRIRYN